MAFDDLTKSQRREVVKLVKELGTGKYDSEFEVDHIPSGQLEHSRINLEIKQLDGGKGFVIEFFDSNDFYSMAACQYIESATSDFDSAHLTAKAYQQYKLLTEAPTKETKPSDTIKFWLEQYSHVEEALREGTFDIAERRFNKWKQRASQSFAENLISGLSEDLSKFEAPNPSGRVGRELNHLLGLGNIILGCRRLLEEVLVDIGREGEEAYRAQPPDTPISNVESNVIWKSVETQNKTDRDVANLAADGSNDARLLHATQLYERVRNLIQTKNPIDQETARLIVEISDDAIDEFGSTDQNRKLDLRTWKAEAEAILPPRTIQELKERAESQLIEKGYPRKKWLRKLFLFVIGVGIIAVALASVYKISLQSKPTVSFSGRVTDAISRKAIEKAKISIEVDQEVPQIAFTDSEGVFHLTLSESTSLTRIRVELGGYKSIDRNISRFRTGIEEIHLEPIQEQEPPTTPSPTPTGSQPRGISNSKVQTNATRTKEARAYKHLDYRKP